MTNRERDKAVERLRETRAAADHIDYSWNETAHFKEWHLTAELALGRLFGDKALCLTKFREIWWFPQVSYDDDPEEVYQEAFMSGLAEAKAVLSAAIRDAEDFAPSFTSPSVQPPHPSGASSKDAVPPPASFQSIAVGELASVRPRVRRSIVLTGVVAAVAFAVWSSLPDDTKRDIFRRSFRSRASAADAARHEQPLPAVQEVWVYPNAPVMGCSNQYVVNVRNVSDADAEFHLSFQPDNAWALLMVGKQYQFTFRNHKYALTLLQTSGSGTKIRIDPSLP